MKLSEVRGDRVFDIIADITEPLCNIAADDAVSVLFESDKPDGMDAKAYALDKVKRCIPSLLRGHKADLIAVLAAIEGTTPADYASNVTVPMLVKAVYDLLTDDDLLGFLS